jgi:hypothetical protein
MRSPCVSFILRGYAVTTWSPDSPFGFGRLDTSRETFCPSIFDYPTFTEPRNERWVSGKASLEDKRFSSLAEQEVGRAASMDSRRHRGADVDKKNSVLALPCEV